MSTSNEMAPQESPLLEARPTGRKDPTVSESKSSAHAHTSFTTDPATRAGDPFAYAGERCALCFGGYVTITVEEDGQEHHQAMPCRRCHDEEDLQA
jgi:hypothetical protein